MITLAGSASVWAIVTAVLVINTRHLMYSAALAPAFRTQPKWMRWFAPFLMVDQVFALAALQTHRTPVDFRRYYLTTAVTLWLVWNTVVPLGMLIGPVVPESWRLDYAPPIMFAGLTMFAVKKVPAGVAAIVGGLVSLTAVGLRDRLGIVVGAVAGALAAAALGTYFARSSLILLLADRTLPTGIERALTNVGPAVLAALTINLAVGSDGLDSVEFAEAAAVIVATGVAVWRRNLIWTFIAGMATLWILSAIT